jgi:hypothetical protein
VYDVSVVKACLVVDADEVVREALDYRRRFLLLSRGGIDRDEDGLLRLNNDAAISLAANTRRMSILSDRTRCK